MFLALLSVAAQCVQPLHSVSGDTLWPQDGELQAQLSERRVSVDSTTPQLILSLTAAAEHRQRPFHISACVYRTADTIAVAIGGIDPIAGLNLVAPTTGDLALPVDATGTYLLRIRYRARIQDLRVTVTRQSLHLTGDRDLISPNSMPLARWAPNSLYLQCQDPGGPGDSCDSTFKTIRDSLGFQVLEVPTGLAPPWNPSNRPAPRVEQRDAYFAYHDTADLATLRRYLAQRTDRTAAFRVREVSYVNWLGVGDQCFDGRCNPFGAN